MIKVNIDSLKGDQKGFVKIIILKHNKELKVKDTMLLLKWLKRLL